MKEHLSKLRFAAYKPARPDPVLVRRTKLIERLQHQKLLAQDPNHLRTTHKWIVNEEGIKQRVEIRKRVRRWWTTDPTGLVSLIVRYGPRAIEFEKGKSAIVLADKDMLSTTFDTLIDAVNAGELDQHLTQHFNVKHSQQKR